MALRMSSDSSTVENVIDNLKKLLFQDNTGKYVVGQPPNVMVYVMLVGVLGAKLTSGVWVSGFDLLFFGAAFCWSYLEIRFGESGIRRLFGGVLMAAIFYSRLAG